MSFRILGLDPTPFAPLFALADSDLAARDIRRVTADAPKSAPCRVTLEDAEPGEELLLLPFAHQTAHSPYKASGPIYIRKAAAEPFNAIDTLPPVFDGRLLAVRAYDAEGLMTAAEVADSDPRALFDSFFADPAVAYLHVHYARRGCYSCSVERA
jgi:hypothetical protein